jgi:HAD superfamily hydrolase (TIGR01509 family)
MTRAVIFDVDGTLIDSVDLHAECWVEALRHFEVEADFDDVRAAIGKGGDQLLPGFVPPDRLERDEEAMERFRSELFKRDYLPRVRPFPGVRALFERLRADGVQAVLASSAKEDEVARFAEIAEIGDLIGDSTSSDDAERSKPFPDIFLAALGKIAPISAAEAVVVGDTPYDAEAARGAGLNCVGVLCGGFTEESLRSAGCIAVYRDPQDLLERYDGSPLNGSGAAA